MTNNPDNFTWALAQVSRLSCGLIGHPTMIEGWKEMAAVLLELVPDRDKGAWLISRAARTEKFFPSPLRLKELYESKYPSEEASK